MALLMPDINLRRAKHHLERYWRKLLGERSGERKRLSFRSKAARAKATQAQGETAASGMSSADVLPLIQNLELDPTMEAPSIGLDKVAGGSSRKPDTELDCGSSPVADNASGSNQEFENSAACSEDLNQAHAAAAIDEAESNEPQSESPAASHGSPKADSEEEAPSSTSTTGTASSVGSAFVMQSTGSTTVCAGKPPLSRLCVSDSPPQSMLQQKHISRVQGPTLGSTLQRVHLNDGDVSELDFSTLAQRDKRLGADGCALVARSLSTNRTVRKLTIRDHAIGDDGASALSKMLCNNTTLEDLDLYGNEIGDRGAEALAQALYGHDSLTHLSLRSNLISDRGAKALAQAIRCNCTLKSLELVHNRISRVGAQALLEALDVNCHLESLNLDANDLPAFVASQLGAALARNRAESLIRESHAAEKKAGKIVRRASGMETEDEDDDDSEMEEVWEEDDDDDSVSSGFLSCSGVTDIPLSSSGLWI